MRNRNRKACPSLWRFWIYHPLWMELSCGLLDSAGQNFLPIGFAQFEQVGRSIEKKIAHLAAVGDYSLNKANGYKCFGWGSGLQCGSRIARLSTVALSSESYRGLTVKFIYLLVVVAFLGISASVAKADGVDPIVFTKGCGGTTGKICDPEFLTPGTTTLTVTESFTCDVSGNCTAEDSVVNQTGVAVNSFTLILSALDSEGQLLSYSCGEGGLFICSQSNATTFNFAGNSLCADADDLSDGTFTPDADECGVIISLTGTTTEGLFTGDTVTASFSTATTPEPSSGLLLMAGLMAGLVSLKTLRSNPA